MSELHELQQRAAKQKRQIDAVHRISAALFSQNELDALLRETLRVSLDTVEADAGSILLYEPSQGVLVFHYVVGKEELIGLAIDPAADINGKAATAFRTGESILTADPTTEGYNPTFDQATGYQTQSLLTVPLKNIGGGEPIGVMQALNKRSAHFDRDDLEILEIVGGLAATSIVNARLAKEAQLAAVGSAVGDLSHDIKNLLTPIETMIETTIDSFIEPMYHDVDNILALESHTENRFADHVTQAMRPLRDWYPEMRSSVRDSCEDIREMVSEIADYIKGTQAPNREIADIGEVIRDRLRRLKVVASNRRVAIHLEGLEDTPPFCFDKRLVGRAVFNLVNNALGAINEAVRKKTLEFRPKGYNVWVRVTAQAAGVFPDGDYCEVTVEDDGPGISARVKASLFTANTISTTPGGTGIGTRFVKSVADAHGGVVRVESVEGKGACFKIRFPLSG